jgi:hypothetical protein
MVCRALTTVSFAVNNDFRQTHGLFELFNGLSVPDLDAEAEGVAAAAPAAAPAVAAVANDTANGSA